MKNIFFIIMFFYGLICNAQIKEYRLIKQNDNLVLTQFNEKNTPPTVLAAPSNDNCSNAIQITTLDGTFSCGYTLNGSTTDLYNFGQCNTKQVWFYFIAQGPNVEITVERDVAAGSNFSDPEIILFAGTNICTNVPTISYAIGASLCGVAATTDISLTNQDCTKPLTIGQTYYFTVDSWGNRNGFCVSVNNPTPNPPGTDCATANIICSNTSFGGNAKLWGNCELTTSTIGGCLGQWGEVNSSWYVVYVDPTSAANATLTFTISPTNGTDDYDYSIWKGATCTLGAPNSCNFSSTVGNTGLQTGFASTSQGVGGTTWNAPIVTQPGDVYIVLINGYTPSSSSFNFNFGGSAILGCSPPTILPIELLNFDIINKGLINQINWSTTTEINNDYFLIKRSIDGYNFESIGKIKGVGNSTQILSYNFIDNNPNPGKNYYRLTQIDYNGLSKDYIIKVTTNDILLKELKYILNTLGQIVDENYKGIIFLYYDNGIVLKKINN